MTNEEKTIYQTSLEQISERDEDSLKLKRSKTNPKDEHDIEVPPKTLKDIFKISNRNRKLNKQKKKNKFDQSYDSESSFSSSGSG